MGGYFCAKNIDTSAIRHEEYFRRGLADFRFCTNPAENGQDYFKTNSKKRIRILEQSKTLQILFGAG